MAKHTVAKYFVCIAFLPPCSDRCKGPNKLVCYTRSSPLVHTLFNESVDARTGGYSINPDTVRECIFEEPNKVVVCKLSGLQSQSSLQELLNDFMSSDILEVCMLLANMQGTTRKTINHVRVMMEEAELHTPAKCSKLFVLLLHFPPNQFYQHCYPSIFLRGWDHCYLDTVSHSTERDVVDIQDWFLRCCFPAAEAGPGVSDSPQQALRQLLDQAIPVLTARINFGRKIDGSFNSVMNATQRSKALKLLFAKGVGKVLCDKFQTYWKLKVMSEYLERAAIFSKLRESTLNITDSIQTQFKALFMDFCTYMLARANENFNLDIIYAADSFSPIQKLFVNIFNAFPVPELDQLNLLSNNLPSLKPPVYCPRFPFFGYLYEQMEQLVDVSGKAVNLQQDVLADSDSDFIDNVPKLKALTEAIKSNLKEYVQVSYKHSSYY